MTSRPLPPVLPPLALRGLRDLICCGDPACARQPELFFGPDGDEEESETGRIAREAAAREVCASCPVRLACLAYALRTRPAAGIWAGCTPQELTLLATAARRPARRGAARPASGEVAA
jgi:hypothetical protein